MKKILPFAAILFAASGLTAQTTHMVDWGMGLPASETNITVSTGDTVMWMWTSAMPHSVTTTEEAAESFDSGILSGAGTTYSHTFTIEGVSPYVCSLHSSMTGSITVENLSTDDLAANQLTAFPNPVTDQLHIRSATQLEKVVLHDQNGRLVWEQPINTPEALIYFSTFRSGLYLVTAYSQGKAQTFRIVKE